MKATADPLARIGRSLVLEKDQGLFREADIADRVFSVSSGMVRIHKLLPDGRRQIIGFLQSGDFLGLSIDATYLYSAETVTACALIQYHRHQLQAVIDSDPGVQRRLYAIAAHELILAQEQMLLLGRKTAIEKLCSFLLRLARRQRRPGTEVTTIPMPMGRADIADYLGLTVETVCRSLTRLKTTGVIRLCENNRIECLDMARLAALAQSA